MFNVMRTRGSTEAFTAFITPNSFSDLSSYKTKGENEEPDRPSDMYFLRNTLNSEWISKFQKDIRTYSNMTETKKKNIKEDNTLYHLQLYKNWLNGAPEGEETRCDKISTFFDENRSSEEMYMLPSDMVNYAIMWFEMLVSYEKSEKKRKKNPYTYPPNS